MKARISRASQDFGCRCIGPTAQIHGIYDSGDQGLRWFGGQASEDFAFEPQFISYRKEKNYPDKYSTNSVQSAPVRDVSPVLTHELGYFID
ncbi:MAG: hypothetical protein EZS28_013331 [Streblomastix strix]|uniref:Uncharacterized protein n=1 Tax=Streblomastix strix TaxID=222440 RepID=A0A5J4W9F5_9EUKA|nr:MAG: hypothetical protein EZS28_013331 [Streblomastix strix]